MTVFWLVAALLIVAALLFVLPPLFRSAADSQATRRAALNVSIYRDQLLEMTSDLENDVLSQEQYQQGREEIEQRMLDDVGDSDVSTEVGRVDARSKVTAIAIAVIMPLAAVAWYMGLGTPEGLVPEEYKAPQMSEQQTADMINQMVTRLAARLEGDPNDAEGWKMLGRSYWALERFDDARNALEEAAQRLPNDAQLLVDLADSIAMTSGSQSLQGRPMALIERALQIEPDNQKALWLGGTAAYDRKDYRVALGYWQRLLAMQPPGSQGARTMEGNIAEIQSLLGESVAAPVAPGPGASSSQPLTSGKITGEISVAAALLGRVKAEDTIFIFAQAPTGPRMPLAVLRATAAELPMQFSLDDSLAMVPEMRLSRFAEVVITARVSKSGNASPQSGDLQGQIGPVSSNNSTGVQLVIDEVLP